MPDESEHRYWFSAMDRASRHAAAFLDRLVKKAPFTLQKGWTDNGKEFTDRFCPTGERGPTGRHRFDQQGHQNPIEPRWIKPRHPQTNGMVERFNGRISEVLATTHFNSAERLEETLVRYVRWVNPQIPQKALGHVSPIQALKEWQEKRPELFKKKVYNLTGPDMYPCIC